MNMQSPPSEHVVNLSVAAAPLASWLAAAPGLLTSMVALASIVYYARLIYNQWHEKTRPDTSMEARAALAAATQLAVALAEAFKPVDRGPENPS